LQGSHDLRRSADDVAVVGLGGEFEFAVLMGAGVVLPLHVADPVRTGTDIFLDEVRWQVVCAPIEAAVTPA
jgi:hypothetical protein